MWWLSVLASSSIWTLLAQLVCDLQVGGGMSLLWWTTTLGMHGCSFLRRKGRRLVLFGILSWGWGTRGTEMPYERFAVTMVQNSETLVLKPYAMTWVLNTSFRDRIRLLRIVLWKGKTEPCLRWLGWCLMSIVLREGSGLRRWIPRAMFRTGSTLECIRENLLRVDARSYTQGESLPCLWLQVLYP
jgi:hypothetical protein